MINYRNDLSQESLKAHLIFCPLSGAFFKRNTNKKVNGYTRPDGYLMVNVKGKQYRAHRLAWLYIKGNWPKNAIDHINGNKLDNRIYNLREATYSQNHMNKKPDKKNKSGFKGVCYVKQREKWNANIYFNGKKKNLGYYNNIEDAVKAYNEAAKKYHGEFAVLN